MKSMKSLTAVACALALFVGYGTAMAESCCVKAKAAGKDCELKCCVDARKDKKTCEKHQKDPSCCDTAISKGKDCEHKCCQTATKEKTVCEKCNPAKKS